MEEIAVTAFWTFSLMIKSYKKITVATGFVTYSTVFTETEAIT